MRGSRGAPRGGHHNDGGVGHEYPEKRENQQRRYNNQANDGDDEAKDNTERVEAPLRGNRGGRG